MNFDAFLTHFFDKCNNIIFEVQLLWIVDSDK